MTTINPLQPLDPVQTIPKETVLQIFSYLSPRDIERSARVSHEWKRFIEPDFSLFTTVVVKTDKSNRRRFKLEDLWALEEKEKAEKMNKAVKSLSRFARLSMDKLKDATIGMAAFVGSMPKSVEAWEYSRLPKLFDILHLSDASLKRLCLEIPELPVNEYTAVALSGQIRSLSSRLNLFPNLKEVEIQASLLFKIVYKSKAKRFKIVPFCSYPLPESHPYYCGYASKETQNGMDAPIPLEEPFEDILECMKDWTKGKLTHLIGVGSSINLDHTIHSSLVLDELLRSTSSLETVHLGRVDHDDTEDVDEDDIFDLVTRSLNLTSFKFEGSRPLRDWVVQLLSESDHVSKLKTLNIDASVRVEWNKGIVKWIGEEIETISLRRVQLIGDLTIPFFLPALKELTLSGNIELLSLFASQVHYPSLTSLILRHNSVFGSGQMHEIIKFVEASSSSLKSLRLSERFNSETDMDIDRGNVGAQEADSIDFPHLKRLRLDFLSTSPIEVFFKSHYPAIKSVSLSDNIRHRKILP